MKKIISLVMAISLFCSLTLQAFAVQWRYDKAVVTIIDNGDTSATAKQGSSGTRQIQYCINSGDWLDYIKPIEIDTEGITKIEARAIDNAGNISPIGDGEIRIDRTPPNAKIAVSTTEWTNKNVELLATASDEHSGVAKIINPIGESSNRYSAPANGTYTFTIIDNVGLSSYASVGISNIEKVIEPLKVDTTDEWTNKPMVIELPKQDKIALSGVSKYQYRIEDKDGQAVNLEEEKPSFFENIVNSLKSLFFVTAYADASDGWYDYIKPIVINGEGIDRVLFRAISHAGNITPVAAIEVKKDYTVPEASIWYNQKTNIVSINATDNLSGVKSITLPAVDKDGKNIVVSGSYAEFSPQKDGDYTVIIEDMATNKAEYTFPIALPVSGSDDDIVAIKPELKAIAGNPPQAIKTPGIVRVTGNFGKVIAANDTAVSDDKQPVENTIVPKTEKTIAVAEPTAKINWLAVFIIIALFFLLIIIIILFILLAKRNKKKEKQLNTAQNSLQPALTPLELAVENYFIAADGLNQIKRDFFRTKIKEYLCENPHLLTYSTTDLNFELDYFTSNYKPERKTDDTPKIQYTSQPTQQVQPVIVNQAEQAPTTDKVQPKASAIRYTKVKKEAQPLQDACHPEQQSERSALNQPVLQQCPEPAVSSDNSGGQVKTLRDLLR